MVEREEEATLLGLLLHCRNYFLSFLSCPGFCSGNSLQGFELNAYTTLTDYCAVRELFIHCASLNWLLQKNQYLPDSLVVTSSAVVLRKTQHTVVSKRRDFCESLEQWVFLQHKSLEMEYSALLIEKRCIVKSPFFAHARNFLSIMPNA